jgi:hypothetical protein
LTDWSAINLGGAGPHHYPVSKARDFTGTTFKRKKKVGGITFIPNFVL